MTKFSSELLSRREGGSHGIKGPDFSFSSANLGGGLSCLSERGGALKEEARSSVSARRDGRLENAGHHHHIKKL